MVQKFTQDRPLLLNVKSQDFKDRIPSLPCVPENEISSCTSPIRINESQEFQNSNRIKLPSSVGDLSSYKSYCRNQSKKIKILDRFSRFDNGSITGVLYYKTEILCESLSTCIDMQENPKIKHQISLRKSGQVFANPNIKHSKVRKPFYKTLEFENVL